MRPKRLQFVEEAESPSSENSSVNCNWPTHRYPTRASRKKLLETFESTSAKGKPLQSSRSNNRTNLPESDQENVGSLANGRPIEPTCPKLHRQSAKKSQDQANSSKLKAVKNQFTAEVIDDSDEESSDNWKDKLKWLRTHREVGLWIQCCRKSCRKWRYVSDIHDPTNVPEVWYCNMHPVPHFASCDYPEVKIPRSVGDSMIENTYNAGSIVWAHLNGYPWWPSMVDDSPFTFCFYQLKGNSMVPFKYNVTWFSDNTVQCSWINVRDLRSYKGNPKEEFLKRRKLIYRSTDYTRQVYRACEIADEALSLSTYERLERFSFGSRWDTSAEAKATATSSQKGNADCPRILNERHSQTEKLPDSAIGSNPFANDSSFEYDAPSQSSSSTMRSTVNTQSSGRSEKNNKRERSVNPDEATEPTTKKHSPSDRVGSLVSSSISAFSDWSSSEDEKVNLPIRTDIEKYTFDQLLDRCTRYYIPVY